MGGQICCFPKLCDNQPLREVQISVEYVAFWPKVTDLIFLWCETSLLEDEDGAWDQQ